MNTSNFILNHDYIILYQIINALACIFCINICYFTILNDQPTFLSISVKRGDFPKNENIM